MTNTSITGVRKAQFATPHADLRWDLSLLRSLLRTSFFIASFAMAIWAASESEPVMMAIALLVATMLFGIGFFVLKPGAVAQGEVIDWGSEDYLASWQALHDDIQLTDAKLSAELRQSCTGYHSQHNVTKYTGN